MLDPSFHITSSRLHLSYLDPSDDAHMECVLRMNKSPKVMAMIAILEAQGAKVPPQPQTIEEVRLAWEPSAERLAKTGCGRYIISLRQSDLPFTEGAEREYIGTVSIQLKRYPTISCPTIPDIGFVLRPEYYGKGYASEACEALMAHFRETKGYDKFAGFTHPDNVSSQKLFTRLGFQNKGSRSVVGVVGADGAGAVVSVWVKGVGEDADMKDFGI
jgi:RimJ/RimL family protein N-acetyltransferase